MPSLAQTFSLVSVKLSLMKIISGIGFLAAILSRIFFSSALALRKFILALPLLQVGNSGTQLIYFVEQVRHGGITHRIDAVENDLCSNEVAGLGLVDDHRENFRHLWIELGVRTCRDIFF